MTPTIYISTALAVAILVIINGMVRLRRASNQPEHPDHWMVADDIGLAVATLMLIAAIVATTWPISVPFVLTWHVLTRLVLKEPKP